MGSECGPCTELDDDVELTFSVAASETPTVGRRFTCIPDMTSEPTPLMFQALFGRWSPPEA
eukprot:8757529-Prorocentrum_lima.AAC.1